MKKLLTTDQKVNEIKYERYKKLIRSLRRGRVDEVSPKQVGNILTKK